ncbi:MAG TPA: hypothetical protein VF670_02260 [Duganella sp.]
MEPTQESIPEDHAGTAPPAMPAAVASAGLPDSLPGAAPESAPRTRQKLPPKGSCWYCEKPLDNVKRFCDKECADAFDEEKEFTR